MLDRTPPPFFRQGPSAFTRLLFFSSLAVFLMVADLRFKMTQPLRSTIATALQPIQQGLLIPVDIWQASGEYAKGLQTAVIEKKNAEKLLTAQSLQLIRSQQLETENYRLRQLHGLDQRIKTEALMAETLYDSPDPYTRKIVIDRGSKNQVVAGSPVMDVNGVLGQVTRVYPLTSEVTLVTDRDAAIPVIVERTQQRGVAYGHPESKGMELRFMAGNADVQVGDTLNTSGLDGVYPTGLPVAKVTRVDRKADSAFARILLATLAKSDNPHLVLVLKPIDEVSSLSQQPSVMGATSPASSVQTRP